MKKYSKRKTEKLSVFFNIQNIIFISVIIFMISYPLFIKQFYYENFIKSEEESIYQGVINFYDTPKKSVIGSDYGFIRNLIDNFESENSLIKLELKELNYDNSYEYMSDKLAEENSSVDITISSINNKDIKSSMYIKDLEYMSSIKEEYNINLIKEGEDQLIIPFCINYNLIIINEDILNDLGIDLPNKEWDYKTFLSLISEIKEKDSEKKYIPFDMYIGEDSTSYLPFILENGYENISYEKIDEIKSLLGEESLTLQKNKNDVYFDFYKGKTAIICGDFSDVNYLIRVAGNEDTFSFEAYKYPFENVYFAGGVYEYALMDTDNMDKKEILYKFPEFIYEKESMNILNILGLIPLSKVGIVDSDIRYSHLNEYVDIQNYYSIKDEEYIKNKEVYFSEILEIIKK